MAVRFGWLKVFFAVLAICCAGPVFAQGGGGFGGGGGGGGAGMGGIQIDPTIIRQRILGNVQDQVGFTDEEWKVIEPKIWKIVSLQAQSGSGGLGGMARAARTMGGGGRGGAGGFNVNTIISQIFNDGKPLPAMQKQQELQALLDSPQSTDLQLSTKLREYRDAVQKAKDELDAAEKELQALLTLRQEAVLVSIGYLE